MYTSKRLLFYLNQQNLVNMGLRDAHKSNRLQSAISAKAATLIITVVTIVLSSVMSITVHEL